MLLCNSRILGAFHGFIVTVLVYCAAKHAAILSEHINALSQPLKNQLFLAISKCDCLSHSPYLLQAEGGGSKSPELQAEQRGRAKQYYFNEYSLSQEYFKHFSSIIFP